MAVLQSWARHTRPYRSRGHLVFAPATVIFLAFFDAGIAEATLILKEPGQARLHFWDLDLNQLAVPPDAETAEVCDIAPLLPSANAPLAAAERRHGTVESGGAMNLGLAAANPLPAQQEWQALPNRPERTPDRGRLAIDENGPRPGAQIGRVHIAPVDFMRLRILQITECQRYLKSLLDIIRSWMPQRDSEVFVAQFDGDIGLGAVSLAAEAAVLPYVTSPEPGSTEITTPAAPRYGSAQRRSSSRSAAKPDNAQNGQEKKTSAAVHMNRIKQLIREIYSSIYTYVLLSSLVAMTLLLRRRV